MEQEFRLLLKRYHELFDGGRCQSWELEELIVKAIKSDTTANHHPKWQEAGHDDLADILVVANQKEYQLQVKSGKIDKKRNLTLSGHRLGRFEGDLKQISDYLNSRSAQILAVPYRKEDGAGGRRHIYRFCNIPTALMQNIEKNSWEERGKSYVAHNDSGVEFKLVPGMSWQIWWKIPLDVLTLESEFSDGQFIS